LTFATVSITGTMLGNTTSNDHPNISTSLINSAKSVNRYWSLTNTSTIFTTFGGVFNFVASDVDAGANTSSFIVSEFTSPSWTSTTIGTRTATSTQATGMTSDGDFAVGEPCVSPSLSTVFTAVSCNGGN